MKKFLLAAIAVLSMVGCSTIADVVRYGPMGAKYYALTLEGPAERNKAYKIQSEYADEACVHELKVGIRGSVYSNSVKKRLCTGGGAAAGNKWPPPKESTFRWKPTKDSDVYLERTLDLEKILSGREVRSARIIIKILHHGIQVYIVEADMNNCTPYGTCRSKAKPERVLVFEDISLAN